MIGYSLSRCVKDIIEGKVAYSQVDVIITGTKALTVRDWEGLIRSYKSQYWQSDPDQAIGVVAKLLSEGKVIQPRVDGNMPPNISEGWWSKDA